MKIKKVEIQAFRAYNAKHDGIFDFTLDDNSASNFVAIYAPNGFGKSSFYDAVEWAITNNVERISGDYNRKNNELAANSTKQEGISQKILRNTNAPEKLKTTVTVSTTWKNFPRTLKKPRTDSRDIIIKSNKKKEAAYFSQVILSQDAIDRFLREAKPQDRYSQFMSYFGDDSDIKRKKIAALINDNSTILQKLRNKYLEVSGELKKPVDVEIFDKFNSLISELNSHGENDLLVTSEFSSKTEMELISFSIARTNELASKKTTIIKKQESLIEKLKQLPRIHDNIKFIERESPKLDKLNKAIADYSSYKELKASNSKATSDLNLMNEKLSTIVDIQLLISTYLDNLNEIELLEKNKDILVKKITSECLELNVLEDVLKRNHHQLSITDDRLLSLRSLLNVSNQTYLDIARHESKLIELNSLITESEKIVKVESSTLEIIQNKLNKITSLNINVDSLISNGSSLIGFSQSKINELNFLAKELASLQLQEDTARHNQHAVNQQLSLHEKIISTGLELLSHSPTEVCPLCRVPHGSVLSLKKTIENNNLLSALSKETINVIEGVITQQKNIKEKILQIVREAIDYQSNIVSELQLKIRKLSENISVSENSKIIAFGELKINSDILANLKNSVFNLNKIDFISKVESDIVLLVGECKEFQQKINDDTLKVNDKRLAISGIEFELKYTDDKVKLLTSSELYNKVSAYIEANGLLAVNISEHCIEKVREIVELKKSLKDIINDTDTLCNQINTRMIESGTWIDFDELVKKMSELDGLIKRSRSEVYDYFRSLEQLTNTVFSRELIDAEFLLSKFISDFDQECKVIEYKVDKYGILLEHIKALKPYLKSIELKQSLLELTETVIKHEKVDATLKEELRRVLIELKSKVDSFFFTDLINSIYKKIDPHPTFKEVEFRPNFDEPERPLLHVVLKDENGEYISPILYFSAAQMNILSLSIFLANALHAKNEEGVPLDVIMIDDPIQSMDSINVLSMIDLLRSISIRFDKQIIISTHDENFFELLQRKIPANALGSKFLKLEKFGVVVPVEPLIQT